MLTKINIFTTADENYSQHLCVMMASLLKNAGSNEDIIFHVFDFGITSKAIQSVEKLKKIKNFSINYIKINRKMINEIERFKMISNIPDHISFNTYIRLLIFDSYKNIGKCLWLDADIVVSQSLKSLVHYPLVGNIIGAVAEGWIDYLKVKTKLSLKKENIYFNAGILVLNLDAYKEGSLNNLLEKKISDKSRTLDYADQDILNIIFEDKVVVLPIKYNMQNSFFNKKNNYSTEVYSEEEITKAKKSCSKIGIVHFNSNIKPWSVIREWPNIKAYSLYWYYIKSTSYKSSRSKYLLLNLASDFSSIWVNTRYNFLYKILKIFLQIPKSIKNAVVYFKIIYCTKL